MAQDGEPARSRTQRVDARAAYRAWRSFDGVGPATQAFLLARMAVAPLGPMDADLRELKGTDISLGCGHGLVERYLAEINPRVTSVERSDVDE